MIWRTDARLLVSEGDAFALIDQAGAVIRWYGSKSYSDEDDLWTWDHHVDGDRFYQRTRIDHAGRETRCDNELVLEHLEPANDPATHALVAAALGKDTIVREEARLRDERAAGARVAAIAGAGAAYDLGDDFARAQQALSARVRAYADPIAADLLRTLIALAAAHAGPAVIAAYARGCRHACFELGVPALENADEGAPRLPALAEQIASQARELEAAADDQEAADALRNASAYRRAAEAITRAARLVA